MVTLSKHIIIVVIILYFFSALGRQKKLSKEIEDSLARHTFSSNKKQRSKQDQQKSSSFINDLSLYQTSDGYVCHDCRFKTTYQYHIIRHLGSNRHALFASDQKDLAMLAAQHSYNKKRIRFKCLSCGNGSYRSLNLLLFHYRSCAKVVAYFNFSTKQYTCSDCNITIKRADKMLKHITSKKHQKVISKKNAIIENAHEELEISPQLDNDYLAEELDPSSYDNYITYSDVSSQPASLEIDQNDLDEWLQKLS